VTANFAFILAVGCERERSESVGKSVQADVDGYTRSSFIMYPLTVIANGQT